MAFAANSLLCRAALGPATIDAAAFTAIRLVSGAAMLAALASRATGVRGGSWASAAALFAYAIAFSFAYRLIPAGSGALILFGSVQATMIGRELLRGDRPHRREWLGLAVALAGLATLTRPGLAAPDPRGAALMALAGVAWGSYTLRGKGSAEPLAATADNFARSVPLALGALVLPLAPLGLSATGALLAATSGALASGLGYVAWYAALRGLSASRAAILQLAVPPLAALGGVVLLGEALEARIVLGGALILGGIALALTTPRRQPLRARSRTISRAASTSRTEL
ncbi:MAG TPA: DMT family transporter [Vicinamibacteria bacterium]|nr:DMT family transporter [Vicinamibacteria bacterium]